MDTCTVVQETPTVVLYTAPLGGVSEVENTRRIHQCDICSSGFERRSNLKAHFMTHTGEKPHKCPHCAMSFSRKYNMKNHILIHTGEKPYKCTCGMSFTRKKYLDIHIDYQQKKTHKLEAAVIFHQQKFSNNLTTGGTSTQLQEIEKPFRCMICFKAFSRKNNLKQHMVGHTDTRPFKCTECGKTFTKKANLKSHLSTHTGEKPHRCSICLVSFSRKSNLTKHMLTHTGHKSHTCTVCGMTFTQKKNLTSHIVIHTRTTPHKCKNCGKCFARKDSLVRHMNAYLIDKTGEQLVSCYVGHEASGFQEQVKEEAETTHETKVDYLFPHAAQRREQKQIIS